MVSGRRGSSSTGCLFSLLLFGAALYFGVPVAGVYVRYYQLTDEMHSEARLAPGLTDETIRRRVAAKVDELGLPDSAVKNLRIKRYSGLNRRITLDTEYTETVKLQFFTQTFRFKPHAEEPL